ncbi:hypothetical protein [Candidatus Sororendozoicomonas aggregata]|uniref:hypothetical protein n=1 Tax=Candidatus Sororendozoicomonas aggregata TaxID=3073239 RepID=UPI002ECFFB15
MRNINECLQPLLDTERLAQLARYIHDAMRTNPGKTDTVSTLAALYPRYDRYLPDIFNAIKALDYSSLKAQVYKRRRSQYKSLKTCFKNNRQFEVSQSWSQFQIVNRSKDSVALRELLLSIDSAIEQGELLKSCKATTVSLYTMGNGQRVIIKRYNPKSTLHSLKRSLILSRARVCWQGALHLAAMGIATPENLAMLEKRQGKWIHYSYVVTEHSEGKTLGSYCSEENNCTIRGNVYRELEDIFVTFPQVLIAHGDFKSTNFIVENSRVLMIDLDSMKTHRSHCIFRGTYLRDIDRFERNWGNAPEAERLFRPLINDIRRLLNREIILG